MFRGVAIPKVAGVRWEQVDHELWLGRDLTRARVAVEVGDGGWYAGRAVG